MIHINSNKNRGSNMFNRRPRSYLPTIMFILVLGGIIYVLYLNNNLQTKIKSLDEKNKRYHDQHQSLSSQLQVVYEDRSRLENSLQKEKYQHQNAKDELQLQKEVHESAIQDVISKHKNEMDSLKDEHDKHKERLADTLKELDDSQSLYNKILIEKESHQQRAEQHAQDKNKLESQNIDLTEELVRLRTQLEDGEAAHAELQSVASEYDQLKDIMKRIGSDILNLDHEHFDKLTEADRRILFAHFGGTADHGAELDQRRIQLKQENRNRQEAALRQQQLRDERSRQLAAAKDDVVPAANEQKLVEKKQIQAQPAVVHDDQINQNQGLGRNQKLDSDKRIEANKQLNIPPPVDDRKASLQNQQVPPVANQRVEPQEEFTEKPQNDSVDPQQNPALSQINPAEEDGNTSKKVAENEVDKNEEEAEGIEIEDPKKDKNNEIAVEEQKANEEERQAQEELQKIENQRRHPDQVEDEEDEVDPNKAIKELNEMHEKQQQIAKKKGEDLKLLAEMNDQKSEENVEEDGNAEESPVKTDDEEVGNQMLQPPGAARVPPADKPVIDLPDVQPNEGDGEQVNIYEEERRDQNARDEEEDDEDEGEYNDAQVNKEEYDLGNPAKEVDGRRGDARNPAVRRIL